MSGVAVRRELHPGTRIGAPRDHPAGWTQDAAERLRTLWAEGHSAAKIGRLMGFTKNAVVGKVHRMGLQGRRSPIIHTGLPRQPRRTQRAPAITIVALASLKSQVVTFPEAAPEPAPVVVFQPLGKVRCVFPLWGSERPTQKFCKSLAIEGKPYCQDHAARCYRKVGEVEL